MVPVPGSPKKDLCPTDRGSYCLSFDSLKDSGSISHTFTPHVSLVKSPSSGVGFVSFPGADPGPLTDRRNARTPCPSYPRALSWDGVKGVTPFLWQGAPYLVTWERTKSNKGPRSRNRRDPYGWDRGKCPSRTGPGHEWGSPEEKAERPWVPRGRTETGPEPPRLW